MIVGAVDIGGTKVDVGAVDDQGRVLSASQSLTGQECEYSRGLELITGMLRGCAHSSGVEMSGIGIGSTGPVHPFSGEFGDIDFLPKWRGRNLVTDLARIFKFPVAIENDADAGALGEAGWGAGKNKADSSL